MRIAVLLSVVFLGLAVSLYGQSQAHYLGIDHGLSNDYVTYIYQDQSGYMWFGTHSGLNRYDGYAFKIFKNSPLDPQSLPDNRITGVVEDKDGDLYVATKVGAAILDKSHTTFSRLSLRKPDNRLNSINFSINQLERDHTGQVFAGTHQAGLLAIEKTTGGYVGTSIPLVRSKHESLHHYNVRGMTKTPDGRLWLVVQDIGICYYDDQTETVKIKREGKYNPTAVASSVDGHLWLADYWGITRYDPNDGRNIWYDAQNGLPTERIVHLYFGRDQKMWICTDGGGIHKMDIHSGLLAPEDEIRKMQLTSNSVFSVYEDQQSRQWIGTLRGGINIIDPNKGKFQLVTNASLFRNVNPKDFILSLEQADDHTLWVGTEGAGLLKWDNLRKIYRKYNIDNDYIRDHAFITDLIQDRHQQLWISTYDRGIFRLDIKHGKVKAYRCFYPNTDYLNQTAWRLFKDSKDNIWASTLNGGQIYILDRKTDVFLPAHFPVYDVLSLFEENEHILWAGSWSSLTRLDRRTKEVRTFEIGTPIRFIHGAGNKYLWVGTEGGGLVHLNTQSGAINRYTEKDGLPSNTLLSALKDELGNLWIATYHGLSKFNPANLRFHNFYKSDGLQSDQFNYNAALKLNDGRMVFGGIRGFNVFHPSDMQFHTPFPKLVLTNFQIDNQPYGSYKTYCDAPLTSVNEMEVPYEKAVLSFSFAALEYTFPEKIKYAYYLEGWDKDWRYVDAMRSASYSRLKEGTYTLRIKSTDANGRWNPVERTVTIRILPPWFRTGWAYTGYALLILSVLYLYKRYVKHRARLIYKIKAAEFERDKEHELNEKKITFFTHVAHEFRTPLTLIVNPLKDIVHHKKEHASIIPELHHIYNNSKRLLSLVDKLLLFRKADNGLDELRIVKLDFAVLAREVFYCFQQLAHSRGISYRFSCADTTFDLYGDREKLEICLFNLFHNAIKFTADRGKVEIKLFKEQGNMMLAVEDSGNGTQSLLSEEIFKPFQRDYSSNSQAKEGFGIGLFLVKKFVSAHNGDIRFEQNDLGGTTFILTLAPEASRMDNKLVFEDVNEHSAFIQEFIEAEVPIASSSHQEKTPSLQPLTSERDIMLIVDDNTEIRAYIRKLFRDDFDILEAKSGEEALELLKTVEPGIVISDVVMHEVSGIDLCERIKKDQILSHIPVILLTASFSPDVKLKGIEGGADDYITKPFDQDILIARVRNLIENKHRLHRYFHSEVTLQRNDHRIPEEYRDFLNRAMAAVERHFLNPDFSVKLLADQLGMSHSNLYRRIKAISGRSANEFIRYIRLRKVAQLLVDTNANVNEAAYAAGFSDIKHFRQQFTKLFGCTPSEYKKKFAHVKNKYQVQIK